MANNRIQIKRSIANSVVTGLNPGELAFTANGNVLYIGHPDIANTNSIRIGGLQVPGTLTANQALVANATSGIDKIIVANLVATSIYANGSFGTANQVLKSDGANVYWTDDVGDISEIIAGNGLSGGGASGQITIDVGAGNGITVNTDFVSVLVAANSGLVANSTGVWVKAGTGITVDSNGVNVSQDISTTANVIFQNFTANGDLTVNNNTILGSNSQDIVAFNAQVNTDIIPSANNTYDLGSPALRWAEVHTANLVATYGNFSGNVSITGDLIVTGNVTTMNVNSLVVKDPIIYLADGNLADTLDIGFAATYNDGSPHRYTGLFRDNTDGVYRLFANTTQDLKSNNAINTADATYAIATLSAYVTSGALVSNSTTVAITANSSIAVSVTANTIKLSGRANNDLLFTDGTGTITGLALGNDGYILQSNGTAIVYDYLDGGTF